MTKMEELSEYLYGENGINPSNIKPFINPLRDQPPTQEEIAEAMLKALKDVETGNCVFVEDIDGDLA